MASPVKFERQLLEGAIQRLLELLDDLDGDSDLEPEVLEEQHDMEADLTWQEGHAPTFYIIAQRAREKARR